MHSAREMPEACDLLQHPREIQAARESATGHMLDKELTGLLAPAPVVRRLPAPTRIIQRQPAHTTHAAARDFAWVVAILFWNQ